MASSDSFRFQPTTLIFKSDSGKDAYLWILQNFQEYILKDDCVCEFWEVSQIPFKGHLWETTYFMYKLQDFNRKINKNISQVLFKHFIQEQEVTIRKRSFT